MCVSGKFCLFNLENVESKYITLDFARAIDVLCGKIDALFHLGFNKRLSKAGGANSPGLLHLLTRPPFQ